MQRSECREHRIPWEAIVPSVAVRRLADQRGSSGGIREDVGRVGALALSIARKSEQQAYIELAKSRWVLATDSPHRVSHSVRQAVACAHCRPAMSLSAWPGIATAQSVEGRPVLQ